MDPPSRRRASPSSPTCASSSRHQASEPRRHRCEPRIAVPSTVGPSTPTPSPTPSPTLRRVIVEKAEKTDIPDIDKKNRTTASRTSIPLLLQQTKHPLELFSLDFSLHLVVLGFDMRISKTEVNLKRLLAAAPRQQNQAKLVHHFKAKLNDYSKKIEALAAQLTAPLLGPVEAVDNKTSLEKEPSQNEQAAVTIDSTQGLRRRLIHHSGPAERTHEIKENDPLTPVRLDDAAQAHIERHRKLQDDLTDEMVVLAQQLKESSLMMNKSLQETEKVLDSTERAVELSLASTGRANVRAMEIYSESAKTSCFTWLIIFMMTCGFIMVVLLIRVT
ncbi:hypothetical protein Taro_003135 [Colocasia esculenta]|uniref:USE1-like protein n=2 Tax=Magnoliopsida TaxID=3398 RepID=A0A843TQT6_COLES|nr:hypothetical protein [Colocasia esculenta]